jgi:hypothetical protein
VSCAGRADHLVFNSTRPEETRDPSNQKVGSLILSKPAKQSTVYAVALTFSWLMEGLQAPLLTRISWLRAAALGRPFAYPFKAPDEGAAQDHSSHQIHNDRARRGSSYGADGDNSLGVLVAAAMLVHSDAP